MSVKDALLPEFDHEMAVTRKLLARAPMDDVDWRPHPRSMSLGTLVSHLVDIPGWAPVILTRDHFDMSEDVEFAASKYATTEALLADFDSNVAAARSLVDEASDAQLAQPWSLTQNGETLLTMPRLAVLRSFLLNHGVHHRGQLSVYLRLREVKVPSIYGPSADEPA
jgi:uncharacterized damage-inducible protein DinB